MSHSTKCQKNVSFKISNSIKCINVSCYMSQKMSYSRYLKIFQEMSQKMSHVFKNVLFKISQKKCLVQQNVKKCLIQQNVSKYVSFKMSQNMSHSKCLKNVSIGSRFARTSVVGKSFKRKEISMLTSQHFKA